MSKYNPVGTPLGTDNPNLGWPEVPCCLPEEVACATDCCCGVTERVLRGYISDKDLPPMTTYQRNWCLNQIGQVEGRKSSEYAFNTDAELAREVLNAWADAARDSGAM